MPNPAFTHQLDQAMNQDPRDMTTSQLLREFAYFKQVKNNFSPHENQVIDEARLQAIEAEIDRRVPAGGAER